MHPGTATTAATKHASAAISAAADATASAATTAADTARQQQQQGQGLEAAGAAAADAVETVTAGVGKGLDQGVEEIGVVGHEGVDQAKQGAQQTTGEIWRFGFQIFKYICRNLLLIAAVVFTVESCVCG